MKTANAIAHRAVVLTLVLAHASIFGQTVQRCVDSKGGVTYTDEACPAASSKRQVPVASGNVLPPRERPAVAHTPDARTLYDRAVADSEHRYPALNPDASAFDRALVERVLKRKEFYAQKSYREDYALRAAVADVMEARPSSSEMTAQAPVQLSPSLQGKDALLEAGAKGAVVGVLLGAGIPACSMVVASVASRNHARRIHRGQHIGKGYCACRRGRFGKG